MERYVRGEVTEQERVKIEAWLEVQKTDDDTDLEMSKQDEDRIFQRLTDKFTSVEDVVKLKPKRKLRLDQWIVRMAAALAIISALSYAAWYFSAGNPYQLEVTSENGVDKIILNDGSLVWMHEGSNISYAENPANGLRYAIFEGDALFEVAKDADRPFIIECGEMKVKVLGTSFNLRTRQKHIELTVLTGKVNLSSTTDEVGIDVLPHEKVIYHSSGEFEKQTPAETEITDITKNTQYDMQFTNQEMREVLARMEKKFDITIKLSEKSIQRCQITADFTDRPLESSLQLMTEILNVEYSIKDSTVTLTGTGCK
ncbi:MAG: FecR family protein [Cyclobacteriaceae bacterium]|nr:FecR family protein [Cyclobacteriaceae bacterium]